VQVPLDGAATDNHLHEATGMLALPAAHLWQQRIAWPTLGIHEQQEQRLTFQRAMLARSESPRAALAD
jgi:hypothetical protein